MKGYCTNTSIGSYGRFANGGFQVAAVLGIARRNGLIPVYPLWQNKDHRDRFGSSEDVDIFRHLVNPLPEIPEGVTFNDREVGWGYYDIDLPHGNWNLSGHFQSAKYFSHCIEEARWQLRMKDEPPQNDRVAIHVRLGDYDDRYHPRLGMDYYGPAMAQFPGAKFLVFSDDLLAAQQMALEMLNLSTDIVYATGNYIEDFALMKRCKSFIIGNSSYSAMAAILGEHPEKRVVAPRPWFGSAYTSIDGEDIYGEDWTVIDWRKAA